MWIPRKDVTSATASASSEDPSAPDRDPLVFQGQRRNSGSAESAAVKYYKNDKMMINGGIVLFAVT